MSEDPYRILGVKRGASLAAITAAYRRQAKLNHPDRHANKSPEEQNAHAQQFQRAKWAYEILRDDDERAFYDANGISRSDQAEQPITPVERTLLGAFERVVAKVSSFTATDLVRLIRECLENDAGEISRKLASARRVANDLDVLSGRFSRRAGGRNIFQQKIAADRKQMAQHIEQFEDELAHLSACLEELVNWSYRRDSEPTFSSRQPTYRLTGFGF